MLIEPVDTTNKSPLSQYHRLAGAFDEILGQDGKPREHWQAVMRAFEEMGLPRLKSSHLSIKKLLAQEGVTYNIYNDPKGIERPWELDPIPVLLSHQEWMRIEEGLIQRAVLLNKIVTDVYEDQRLIKEKLIPPEIIFNHVGYLRACQRMYNKGLGLFFYAVDLARSQDGSIYVMSDRTQNPSGAGYALQNRIAMGRVLSSLFQNTPVLRYRQFFRNMRHSLSELSPRKTDQANVVVLTPGAGNETYFEHAYLAKYLGYMMAEGNELVVKDQKVWFRSLQGLQQVDVILRRVDDIFCDPLELKGDSLLGVPGLLQAIRSGNVTVCNPIGCSILQNPALIAFLPKIARYYLNENLKLPSVPTYWCGHEQSKQYVLDNLDQMVIKPLYPNHQMRLIFGNELNKEQLNSWKARICQSPSMFVGQQQVPYSTVALLGEGRLEPRHMGLRTYLCADGDSYTVMPGGLARVSPAINNLVVSTAQGGLSKDTWVLSPEPIQQTIQFPLPAISLQPEENRGVSQRIINNLFWIGRYAKRSETLARLVRKVMFQLMDHSPQDPCVNSLLKIITHQSTLYPGFLVLSDGAKPPPPESELLFLLTDAAKPGTLAHNIKSLITSAHAIRDHVSDDMFHVVTALKRDVDLIVDQTSLLELLERMVINFSALRGIFFDSMHHGIGWRFWEIGRRVEWAYNILIMVWGALGEGADLPESLWDTLLDIEDSQVIYRNRYAFDPNLHSVFELMILNPDNPRSVRTQLTFMEKHSQFLLDNPTFNKHEALHQRLKQACEQLTAMTSPNPPSNKPDWKFYQKLRGELDGLIETLREFSDDLHQHYLQPMDFPRQLGDDHA